MKSLSRIYNDYFSTSAVYSYRQDERIFRTRFMRAWFVILLVIVAVVFLGSTAGIGANEYHYFIMNLILINLIAATGLQLLIGFTGLLSLGHAAFMGVGAYTSALLVTKWGGPFLLSIFAAGLVAAFFGIIVGIPSLRIKGFYLMVATIAFQFVIEYIIILFMVIAGISFIQQYRLWVEGRPRRVLGDVEIRNYLILIAAATVVIAVPLLGREGYALERAFRSALFQVGSIVTTTGFITDDLDNVPDIVFSQPMSSPEEVARAVIEAHSGTVDVESREGEGTSVTVRLPGPGLPGPAGEPGTQA